MSISRAELMEGIVTDTDFSSCLRLDMDIMLPYNQSIVSVEETTGG